MSLAHNTKSQPSIFMTIEQSTRLEVTRHIPVDSTTAFNICHQHFVDFVNFYMREYTWWNRASTPLRILRINEEYFRINPPVSFSFFANDTYFTKPLISFLKEEKFVKHYLPTLKAKTNLPSSHSVYKIFMCSTTIHFAHAV